MDWVLVVLVLFKALVFITGMVFAIKWHYDREKMTVDRRALIGMGVRVLAVFVVLLFLLLALTFGLARTLGMDLSLP